MKKVPPAPQGWNKTIADLFAEVRAGHRSSIGSPETDWARQYERSLLPHSIRFPRKGDVYQALEDVETGYLTSWAMPYTGSGTATIIQGERVEIRFASATPDPIMIYAYPLDYSAVEARVVPERERRAEGYEGFSFVIKTVDLNAKFRLIVAGQ